MSLLLDFVLFCVPSRTIPQRWTRNNSCQKIEITGSKKMPYNHDYSEDVKRRSDTTKLPINWVHMSTFDCLNKTKRHCSLNNLIVMIISDWLTLADKALINVSPTRTNIVYEMI